MSSLIFDRRGKESFIAKTKSFDCRERWASDLWSVFPPNIIGTTKYTLSPSIIRGERKTARVWHLLLRQCADRSYHAKRKTWMWIVEHFRLRQRISVGFCVRALYTPWIQCAEQGNRLGYLLKHFLFNNACSATSKRPLREFLSRLTDEIHSLHHIINTQLHNNTH